MALDRCGTGMPGAPGLAPRPHAPRALLSAALLLASAYGCGDGLAPPPPAPDAGRLPDAAPVADAALPDAFSRGDGGPALPPSDVDVVLPYLGPVHVERIVVDAAPGALDVHVSVDTTGSFAEEIDAIQADLDTRIIPAVADEVEAVAFGVSRFEDFPEQPWGAEDDHPFELLTPITTDRSRIRAAVNALDSPLGNGGDPREAGAEALYQIATGAGYRTVIPAYDGRAAPGGGNLGGVGFRPEALHVVVHITDVPPHEPADYEPTYPGTHGLDDVVEVMRALDARVIGIASSPEARPHLSTLALATGAVSDPVAGSCPTGVGGSPHDPVSSVCPLVFDVNRDGTGLSDAMVDALVTLVQGVSYEEVWGEAPDDRLGFVQAIAAASAETSGGAPEPGRADRRPPDGIDDTFLDVRGGTRLTFEARLQNVSIPPEDYDQVFRVTILVRGDGLVLARRTVRVTVPRGRLDAGAPADAGGPDASGSDAGPADAAATDAAPPGDAAGDAT